MRIRILVAALFLQLHAAHVEVELCLSPPRCKSKCALGGIATMLSLRLRGGVHEEGEEEDPTVRQRIMGDKSSGAGMRILAKRLRQATHRGDAKAMGQAIEDGADVMSVDLAGFSNLHLAAEAGHAAAAAFLISKVIASCPEDAGGDFSPGLPPIEALHPRLPGSRSECQGGDFWEDAPAQCSCAGEPRDCRHGDPCPCMLFPRPGQAPPPFSPLSSPQHP